MPLSKSLRLWTIFWSVTKVYFPGFSLEWDEGLRRGGTRPQLPREDMSAPAVPVIMSTQWVAEVSKCTEDWLRAQPKKSPEMVFNKPPGRGWEI